MGVTVYTGWKSAELPAPSRWLPFELSEVASLLTIACAAYPRARVLLLTGVEHALIKASEIRHKPGAIKIVKETGDLRAASQHVQEFCRAINTPPTGKAGAALAEKNAGWLAPRPVVIINDVDYWITGGAGGIFTGSCDPTQLQRVGHLADILDPFGGELIVMAAFDKPHAKWSEVVEQHQWCWRSRGSIVFQLTGMESSSENDSAPGQASSAKSDRKVKVPEWCNAPDIERPATFQFGPLTGNQKELAAWLYPDGKADPRRLHRKVKNGTVWVRHVHRYSFEVFFKRREDYEEAKKRMYRLAQDQPTKG